MTRRTVALVDASKYGVQSLLPVARADELEAVIVDDGLPDAQREELRRVGTNLVVAGRDIAGARI